MVFIKGRSNDVRRKQNNGYIEVEIEACDHDNTIIFTRNDWTGTNTKAFVKYDLEFLTASSSSSSWYATVPLTIDEAGEYRIQIYALTSSSYAETIEIQYPTGTSLGKQSIKAQDEFVRCFDFGTKWFPETDGTGYLKIVGGGHTSVALVVLKRINRYTGNSDGVGDIKIESCKFSSNGIKSIDTFEMTILNHPKFADPSADDYHKSGLVFEFGDSINIKMGESKKTLNHEFGGYITLPELSDNELTIKFSGVDRMNDLDKKQLMKELVIGGSTTSQTGLAFTTNNEYTAFSYLLDSIELPLKSSNLAAIMANKLQTKYGLTGDCGNVNFYNKFTATAMTKSLINNATKGTVMELQNNYKANTTQSCIIFDSDKHVVANAPVDIINVGTFWLEYGTGKDAPEKKVVTEIVTTKKKLKSGKIKIKKKKVKKTITYYGYDIQKPFLCWVELQYSTTPTGTLKTVNIDFTSNTTSNCLGEMEPQIAYNFWDTTEFDVVGVLTTMDPQSHYYIRKITLKTKTAAEALYDPTQEEGKGAYRMMFKKFGFKSGSPVLPEEIKIDGKSQYEALKTICDDLDLHAQIEPASERRNDTMFIEPLESVLCDFEIEESKNLIDITNLKYAPADNLTNAVVKVYKNTSGTYNAVRKVDPESIARFGTYQSTEVLQEEPGEYQARYQAITDLTNNTIPNWSFTAKVWGLPNAKIGRMVPVTTKDSFLNDIKIIESIECYYESKGRKVYCELGLDNPDYKMVAKEKVRQMRKSLLPTVEYEGGAAYEDAVDL